MNERLNGVCAFLSRKPQAHLLCWTGNLSFWCMQKPFLGNSPNGLWCAGGHGRRGTVNAAQDTLLYARRHSAASDIFGTHHVI